MTTIITGNAPSNIDIDKIILSSRFNINYLITGDKKGVEKAAQRWAKRNKVPIFQVKPEDYTDTSCSLILVWDGKDKTSQHILDQATAKGLRIYQEII